MSADAVDVKVTDAANIARIVSVFIAFSVAEVSNVPNQTSRKIGPTCLPRVDCGLDHTPVLHAREPDLGDRLHDRVERAGREAGPQDVPKPVNFDGNVRLNHRSSRSLIARVRAPAFSLVSSSQRTEILRICVLSSENAQESGATGRYV